MPTVCTLMDGKGTQFFISMQYGICQNHENLKDLTHIESRRKYMYCKYLYIFESRIVHRTRIIRQHIIQLPSYLTIAVEFL